MRFCQLHWDMCREAISQRGMEGLIAKSGEQAVKNAMAELEGEKPPFDPLMSMNWHWYSAALKNGGLYLMEQDPSGANEGHYCPLCEFTKHAKGFDGKTEIEKVADQMAAWCREQGLIPKIQ